MILVRVLLLMFLLFTISDARENPFFPAQGEKDTPYTSNEDRSLSPLKRATISLPDYARVIQKVTVEYKSLDGSVQSKSIDLENSIDWHLPIFISQSYTNEVPQTKIVAKKRSFKKIASFKYGLFYSSDKTLKITTKDKIIRDFLLVNPHRIVVDFKRDTSLKTYIKENKNGIFTKIRVGNHSGYYRVVVELDGHYRYKKKKTSDGYIFVLQ
ncbi:MAG: AMIN domain-containing protein [Campylobacterota bacterium]|nr:AMIN domain-containing protein [Campylobacterota bacterium]